MNNDKHHMTSGADISINENMDYDDTDLLSKMFSKDQNRSGVLNLNNDQVTL
jgi:hypothetical protein